jgi:hypothetical protein
MFRSMDVDSSCGCSSFSLGQAIHQLSFLRTPLIHACFNGFLSMTTAQAERHRPRSFLALPDPTLLLPPLYHLLHLAGPDVEHLSQYLLGDLQLEDLRITGLGSISLITLIHGHLMSTPHHLFGIFAKHGIKLILDLMPAANISDSLGAY